MKIHVPRKLVNDYKKFIQSAVNVGLEMNTSASLTNTLELEGRKYFVELVIKRSK
jgi:hypothetical protein